MDIKKILIANRGEIAIRIARAAAGLGIPSVAIYSKDDAQSLHINHADEAALIPGRGAQAYLGVEAIISTAQEVGADALHPGYGFLSESTELARRCAEENIIFIGPSVATLGALGDKAAARQLAINCQVPVVPGSESHVSLAEAKAFAAQCNAKQSILIKAISGGGGRGMRTVNPGDDIAYAYDACAREAKAAFNDDRLYIEQLIQPARHIEVQILGDGEGNVTHFWERECTLQRRNQKLIEIAPSPSLAETVRQQLLEASIAMAQKLNYKGLGTFEYLVTPDDSFYFIEANPRLQVEHTITEQITGVDLVQAQIMVFMTKSLPQQGIVTTPNPQGFAIQCRVNMETMDPNGTVQPNAGTLSTFEPPAGPGIRVDTFGYNGYTTSLRFDSLLAKVITHSRSDNYSLAIKMAYRALCEFRIEGVATNLPFLQTLLSQNDVIQNEVHTRYVDEQLVQLAKASQTSHPQLFPTLTKTSTAATDHSTMPRPEGTEAIRSPMQGQLNDILVAEGDAVSLGEVLAIVEAMKMEHEIKAPTAGIVHSFALNKNDIVTGEQAILFIEPTDTETSEQHAEKTIDPDYIRPDLAELYQREHLTQDAARPEKIAKRHSRGMLSARENIANICDPNSFIEYGALAFAAQRRRRKTEDLIHSTPADGLITGIGSVNSHTFTEEKARCAVLAYDYTVLAGTQGTMNHRKTDRILHIAEEQKLPVIFFTEGGGGRPGDTDDGTIIAGLNSHSFLQYARLTAQAPRIAIASGRCFAGNAVLAGSSDLLIATQNTSLGMAGPAMIEGGGLGVYSAEEVGPMSVQVPNGVVDCLVENEQEAATVARQLMSYFQGDMPDATYVDQRLLRSSIPENRLRSYDIHALITTLVDTDSFLELRPGFAPGMVTAFARIDGKAVGVIANNSMHLGGAICADGADKASRFMQLCDAFNIPIVSLCDTPGFMVGPEAEKTGLVRHTSRLFVTAATLQVPVFTVVLRKGYGLGAMAMTAGSFHAPFFTIAWPTGEFGGMGLEGAVRLGFRNEIANAGNEAAQQALFEQLVAQQYEKGKAINMAAALEIDAVIDPTETRHWLSRGLISARATKPRTKRRRTMIDTW